MGSTSRSDIGTCPISLPCKTSPRSRRTQTFSSRTSQVSRGPRLRPTPVATSPPRLSEGEGRARFPDEAKIEMSLAGVRIELPTNQPIVLLREAEGERFLPIWIGQAEAAAIALALQGVVTPRPMTHDLLKNILEEIAVQFENIVINELREGTFYAV